MDPSIRAQYQTRAQIIKAVSRPMRLFLVEELLKGQRCVCELTKMVGDDISTISKHLSVLKNAGIVADQRRGTQVFYSLRVPGALNLLSCVEVVLKADARKRTTAAR